MTLLNSLKQSLFLRQVIVLSSGTAIAQAIAIGLLPVLTRLYSPEDFGALTLYISIASLLYVFGSLRYEALIMLPRSHNAADQLVQLILFISAIASVVLLIIVLLFRHRIAHILGNPDISPWLFFLPFSVFVNANYQALRYRTMRLQQFGSISQGVMLRTAVNFTSAIGLKQTVASLSTGGGLVISALISDLANFGWLLRNCKERTRIYLKTPSWNRLMSQAKRHGPMAATLTLSQGIGALNSRMPSLMVSAVFGPAALGLYGIAERIATAPAQLVASAIGDVYRQRATVLYQKEGRFEKLMIKTLVMTFFLAIVPYMIGIFYAPEIFRFALGAQWEEAGKYASIILVSGFISFIMTPADKGAIIVGAKRYIFYWHLLRFVFKLVLLGVLYIYGMSIYALLWSLVMIRVVLYAWDLWMEYRYAQGI